MERIFFYLLDASLRGRTTSSLLLVASTSNPLFLTSMSIESNVYGRHDL